MFVSVAARLCKIVSFALLLVLFVSPVAAYDPIGEYAVVIQKDVAEDAQWAKVVDAIRLKYAELRIITFEKEPTEVALKLAVDLPDRVAFVLPPDRIGRPRVVAIHRMMRHLDDDPYTDAVWSIITGYEPADAIAMIEINQPLLLRRGASGIGPGGIGPFSAGFATGEGQKGKFFVKTDGKVETQEFEPDCVKPLVEGFNTKKPQCFVTSGHATTRDWQIGYNYPGGQIRNREGKLYGLSTDGKSYPIDSPESKVYLPVGNCLIGDIPTRDCMATAWMHSGGVRQMFGYTAVTWFGRMGWGVRDLFFDASRDLSLVDSWFLMNQAVVHELQTRFPQAAGLDFPVFDERVFQQVLPGFAMRHGLIEQGPDGRPQIVKDALGLLWDRDTVAFYGDPGVVAQVDWTDGQRLWTGSFSQRGQGEYVYTIEARKDCKVGGKPVMALLPARLDKVKITNVQFVPADVTSEERPDTQAIRDEAVVTDNFILLPFSISLAAGDKLEVKIEGQPYVADSRVAARAEMLIATIDESLRDPLSTALARAGQNRAELLESLDEARAGQPRDATAFLIAFMPPADLKTLSAMRIIENVKLAFRAWEESPWQDEISFEMFCNDILPYAVVNEARDPWRRDFFDRFAKKAWKKKTLADAACWLNKEVFKEFDVKYHGTKRSKPNQSPAEMIDEKFASCTGQSILMVDACRACGIPARLAGIVSWKVPNTDAAGNHGGNHSWVEFFNGEKWCYLGASESTEPDKAWFSKKVKEATDPAAWPWRIHATSWKPTGTKFPMVWALNENIVNAVNVTGRYRE